MKIAKVTRPINGAGDADITLTATITKGEVTKTLIFPVIVKEQGLSDTQCVAEDKAALDIIGKESISGNIILPVTGANGTTSTWESDKPDVVSNSGIVTRPANGAQAAAVVLTATITKGAEEDTKTISVTVMPWTDSEEVDLAIAALTWDVIRGNNLNEQMVTSNLTLITTGERETTIEWSSTNATAVTAAGLVTRPAYSAGDSYTSLTATVTKGTATKSTQFLNLKVVKMAQTNEEAVTLALSSLTDAVIKGDNVTLAQVTVDLVLPKAVSDTTPDTQSVTFTWQQVKAGGTTASDYLTISDAGANFVGTITRPAAALANEQIELIATATSTTAAGASCTDTKTFNITILKQTA